MQAASALIEAFALAACTAALLRVCLSRRRRLRRDASTLMGAILLVAALQAAGSLLESLRLARVEVVLLVQLRVLVPILWGFFFYACVRDTARRELEESEERSRILLASIPQRIFFKTVPGLSFSSVNEAFAADLGLEPAEVIGKTDFDLFPRELAEKYRSDDLRILAAGRPETLTERNISNRVERVVEVAKAPVTNDAGEAVGLFGMYADVTERVRAEQALERRASLETLATTIASRFINLESSEMDQGIDEALKAAGQFAGVDRSYLFQLDETGHVATNTHEWCAEGIEPEIGNPQQVRMDEDLPWSAAGMRRLEDVCVRDVADLPSEAARDREYFQKRGIRAVLALPMVGGGRLLGSVGFASLRSPRAWDEDTIVLLRHVGMAIANALERKRAEEALRASRERYRLIFENARDMITVHALDEGFSFLYVNPAAQQTLGYAAEQLVGKDALQFIHPEDRETVGRELSEAQARAEGQAEFRYRKADGSYVWLEVTGRIVPDERGKQVGLLISRDITERVLRREELVAQTLEDSLTGVNNRRGFYHLADQQLRFAQRTRSTLLLFFLDVDNMKWINDELGHKEGDLALIETANVLREAFRDSDIIGRLGGDEFAVLAIEARETKTEHIVARLAQRLQARNAQPDRRYRLSLSVGIASYDPAAPLRLDELMARADALMYENKRAKHNAALLRVRDDTAHA